MSVKISGQVWELDLDPMDKFVLLALSDHADHEGQSIKPGNALLCAKTGLSEKTIGMKIARFLEMGILEPVEVSTGRGNVREFSANLEGVERHPYFIEKDKRKVERASTFQNSKRSNLTPIKVELDAVKVELDGITYKEHEPSEPSKGAAPSVASLICSAYETIATDYKSQTSLQSQIIQLNGATVPQVSQWLETRRSLSSIGFIAQDFKKWQADQSRKVAIVANSPPPNRYRCDNCQDTGSTSVFVGNEFSGYADCPVCQKQGAA